MYSSHFKPLVPSLFLEGQHFSANSGGELRVAKIKALLRNVRVQLASHLDVLYIVEFSFRSDGSQRRSICVFGAYIQEILTKFFWGSYCSMQEIFQTLELYRKSQPKLQFVYSKRKVSTKLFYAPKQDEKKFGPEYEATN